MSPDETHRLAIAVENLRGTVQEGFAVVRGDLNLLARGENHNTRRIDDLEGDVEELKARRFPLPTIGGIMGVAGVCVSVVALVQGR